MRALFVGGSIAGLSAAHALRRQGIEVVVLERSDGSMRDRGAGLGLDAVRLRLVLGRADAALPPCVALQGSALHALSPEGRRTGRPWHSRLEAGEHPVSCWRHLHEALRAGVDELVQTHAQLMALGQVAARWQVTAQNDQTFDADLLVGAGGHRSVVRR